jgi:heme-degrading monooxygenase HmoA
MLIEINTFRLADGADHAAFLEIDDQIRTGFLYHQPGLVRATTARGDDGEYVVILLWESEEQADASAAKVWDDPAFIEMHQLTDDSTFAQRKYTTFD